MALILYAAAAWNKTPRIFDRTNMGPRSTALSLPRMRRSAHDVRRPWNQAIVIISARIARAAILTPVIELG